MIECAYNGSLTLLTSSEGLDHPSSQTSSQDDDMKPAMDQNMPGTRAILCACGGSRSRPRRKAAFIVGSLGCIDESKEWPNGASRGFLCSSVGAGTGDALIKVAVLGVLDDLMSLMWPRAIRLTPTSEVRPNQQLRSLDT